VLEEGVGERGEVLVLLAEEEGGINGLGDLDECAVGAEGQDEGKARLGTVEEVLGQEVIGWGHLPEVEDGLKAVTSAGPAGGGGGVSGRGGCGVGWRGRGHWQQGRLRFDGGGQSRHA